MSTVLQERPQAAIDTARIEVFEGRLLHALNKAGMLLMTSIGHRTGLFQTLADGDPVTSASPGAGRRGG